MANGLVASGGVGQAFFGGKHRIGVASVCKRAHTRYVLRARVWAWEVFDGTVGGFTLGSLVDKSRGHSPK